ncbi:proto-oncogene c-Fos-like [Stylophora pistillata]|nr:proto-oncogene c-Fos-like [Stylophora pistillata]
MGSPNAKIRKRRTKTLRVVKPDHFFKNFTGQVAKIPPLKELDFPLPIFDGLDLKQEPESCGYSSCAPMDVLDLYESGEWSAANSPCSELFEDVDVSSASDLDESCSYLNDIAIDFASYLDPATLSTSPEDLSKYLAPKEPKRREVVEPYLPEVEQGYSPVKVVKVNSKVNSLKPAVTYKSTNLAKVPEQKSNRLPSIASQLKAPKSRRGSSSSKKAAEKGSDEYRLKRERNNIAVRKSRFKSKQKYVETQHKVDELQEENARLQSKVDFLTKELNVLRSLFSTTGAYKDPSVNAALMSHGIPTHHGLVASR